MLAEARTASDHESVRQMCIKKKAEQEAFSRYGLTYIVDEYLPAKLKETD